MTLVEWCSLSASAFELWQGSRLDPICGSRIFIGFFSMTTASLPGCKRFLKLIYVHSDTHACVIANKKVQGNIAWAFQISFNNLSVNSNILIFFCWIAT